MFAKISIAALFAGLAAAYHAPVGEPNGNPITRPLNEIVPAGKAFEITWTPTTSNTVSLVLLKGPAINVIPQYAIVEGIPNSGKFSWTPDAALEATAGPNGYGIQIIDDVNGQFQYSTQFGISSSGKVSSSAPVPSKSAAPAPSSSGYAVVPSGVPTTIKTSAAPSSTPCTTTTAYVPAGTGSVYPPSNGTIPAVPTGALPPKPSSPVVGGNSTAPFIGAASGLQAGVGLAGAAAALAMFL
ncbi:unnamed protein product [Periconia digitata]|uniref:Yeast cell wall synthesis Kre9/Knh1-like N-terminal domain-containing protein n=1 Tax=Periconia digitata TaxID=1303443 RepID=A0A9W4XK40_9PLEO|nr:unnamed protein product [Periconia digitata]